MLSTPSNVPATPAMHTTLLLQREYLRQKGKMTYLHLYQPVVEAVFIQFATTSKTAAPPRERYIQNTVEDTLVKDLGLEACPSASLHRSLILKI